MWWHTWGIPVLGRLRKEDKESKASLRTIANLKLTCGMARCFYVRKNCKNLPTVPFIFYIASSLLSVKKTRVCVCVSVWQGLSITLASPKLARRPSLLLTDTEGPGSASQALGLTVCITVVSLATLKVVMHLQGFMCADAGQCYHHCTDILWKENQTICHQSVTNPFAIWRT